MSPSNDIGKRVELVSRSPDFSDDITMTPHYRRVKLFMELAKQDTPDSIKVPDLRTRKLRAMLILEEALETIVKGLGLTVTLKSGTEKDYRIEAENLDYLDNGHVNIIELADGCADLSVVNTGTLIAFGIKDADLLEEVDRSNMAKFAPGHYINEHGKLIKPPGWRKPDIAKAIGYDPLVVGNSGQEDDGIAAAGEVGF